MKKNIEPMRKAIIPINSNDITEAMFNHYDFYYRVNETDYKWCICWDDYVNRKKSYTEWYISVPVNDVLKFLNHEQ